MKSYRRTFKPKLEKLKKKKNHSYKKLDFFSKKVFLKFWEMELFSPKIIENLYSTREISKLGKLKKRHLKKFVIFREIELSSPKLNKLLYFRRELAKPKKPKKSTLKKFIIFFQSKVLLKFWNGCWSCRDIKNLRYFRVTAN